MRHLLIFCIAMTLIACKNNPSPSSETTTSNDVTEQVKSGDTTSKPSLADATQYIGKKPSEVNLFSKYNLENRIEKMLQGEYQNFKESLTDETVIMEDGGGILYFIVCKASSCPANKYFVMLDTVDPNINVISIRGGNPKSYEEYAIIGMSDKIAKDFDRTIASPKL